MDAQNNTAAPAATDPSGVDTQTNQSVQTQQQAPDVNTVGGMQNLINNFDQNNQAAQGNAPQQNEGDPNQGSGEPDQGDGEGNGTQPPKGDKNQPKDHNAFAAMRIQNKQLTEMLGKIAKANGIEYTNQEDLLRNLNDDSIGKLAQQQGVPKELLQRMEMLERNSTMYLQEQKEKKLTNDFANLQTKYGLDKDGLMTFAQQLQESNIDPISNEVDIESEYVRLNLDNIVNSRVQSAVEAALKRDAQVDAQSTKPNAFQGSPAQGGNIGYNINTSAGLSQFLAQLTK